jgi:hypothetical protein
MRRVTAKFSLAILAAAVIAGAIPRAPDQAEPQLAHIVFFTLKDRTPEARERLAASCRKYLGDHEGTVYFSVGTIAEDVKEPVSDREFDVALHLVFENKTAEAKYLKHPNHQRFVDEGKATWSKVRVFDSYVAKP